MPHDFLSIGECMVEMAPLASGNGYALGFAGDTFNTAWYMRKLQPDWDVQYMTRAGQDDTTDQFFDLLAASNIGVDHIERMPDRTLGLYLISLQDGERSFSYWRGQSAARTLADDPASLTDAIAQSEMIYISGITLAVLPSQGRQNLLAALATARENGAQVAFDPNLRPRLWESTEQMLSVIMQAAAVSDIVLPSYEDEETFFNDASPEGTRQRYLDAGATTVVVKNGPGQIVYSHAGEIGLVDVAPATNVVDTTAAGDSFNAGFLSAFKSGKGIEDCIAVGSALAKEVISGRGALVEIDG